MDLRNIKWGKKKYQQFISYLKNLKEDNYAIYQKKSISTKYVILGIRLPKIRHIAKEIFIGDYSSFLKFAQNIYYEEILIKALVIAQIEDKFLFNKYINELIRYIDNWAICDSFCNSLKIISQNPNYYFNYFKKYTKSKKEYKARIGIVIILNFFVKKEYINQIFLIINDIDNKKYYVRMAVAWLLCECFIEFEKETYNYLLNSNLDKFTFNKTISKINESFRVQDDVKEKIKNLRKNVK